jgi:HlyD family secretion protein
MDKIQYDTTVDIPKTQSQQNPSMDRKIAKKKWTTKRILTIAGVAAFLGFVGYLAFFADKRSKLNVETEKLSIAPVKQGVFQEFIVQTGNILPLQTVFIDAIEGGIIDRIYKESGAMVKKGDSIMRLTNSNLQLNVMTREAALYDQINNLRNTRLNLEQNDITRRQQLVEIDYNIMLFKPQYERQKKLLEAGAISKQEFEQVKEQYDYQVKRKKLVQSQYANDSSFRAVQLDQFKLSEQRMFQSLTGVGLILDNLVVRAPIDGQLATPDWQRGQNINTSQRIGQIDRLDNFKLRVRIDELYLPRINVGQKGSCDFNGGTFGLEISKIYPTITDGRFDVDMTFTAKTPEGIKRGQSMRARIDLGDSEQAVLLPIGGFYKDTGGNWVYVLDESGKKAVKREIRLGRKNTEYFEVLDGLKEGEKVITSSYEYFGDNEVLVLSKEE